MPTIEPIFVVAENNTASQLYIDPNGDDYEGLSLVAACFRDDVNLVADAQVDIIESQGELLDTPIIWGSLGNNDMIDRLVSENKFDPSEIKDKWESYKIEIIKKPMRS